MDSGLASDHVTVLELDCEEPGKRNLWIGTPCGLSCYTYRFSDNYQEICRFKESHL